MKERLKVNKKAVNKECKGGQQTKNPLLENVVLSLPLGCIQRRNSIY